MIHGDNTMNDQDRAILVELIKAAQPFASGDIVDETSGTLPLMARLVDALARARALLEEEPE